MGQSPGRFEQSGFGLSSMRQRATAIGGEWRLDTAPARTAYQRASASTRLMDGCAAPYRVRLPTTIRRPRPASPPSSTSKPTWRWLSEAGDGDGAIALYEPSTYVLVLGFAEPRQMAVACRGHLLARDPKACILVMTTSMRRGHRSLLSRAPRAIC